LQIDAWLTDQCTIILPCREQGNRGPVFIYIILSGGFFFLNLKKTDIFILEERETPNKVIKVLGIAPHKWIFFWGIYM
jgi:hypothetical protein